MLEFIQRLQQRYKNLQQITSPKSELYDYCTNILKTLAIAETLLLKQQRIRTSNNFPYNIVVFGPTQAGKSTLVNCLLPEPIAGVSSLAGYTVHAQGFATGFDTTSESDWLNDIFPGYQRITQTNLDHSNLANYALTELASSHFQTEENSSIVWDTPDFDSVDAGGYLDSVIRTIGIADILILIVSKEKYADQSVWDMLELLAPLQRPLLVCINKLARDEETTLFRSFLDRYKHLLPGFEPPTLLSIPFIETKNSPASNQIDAEQIIEMIKSMIITSARDNQEKSNAGFIELHWEKWLKAVEEEIEQQQQWEEKFQQSINSTMQSYKSEFLDHPEYYDTFHRTMAELLELLEIPGLAQTLGKARDVITWPVRKLITIGQNVFQDNSEDINSEKDKSYEADLLRQLLDQVLTDLVNSNFLDAESGKNFSTLQQQEFYRSLNRSRSTISDQFDQKITAYQSEFEHEIQSAAEQLYTRLEEQPTLLNSLRAARVTTDAAAVVLALKTGGLSLNDFILAPAMLSLSSMLAESSVGQYINVVKTKLKVQQYETVQSLLENYLRLQIDYIRESSTGKNQFQITHREIEEVESEFFGK